MSITRKKVKTAFFCTKCGAEHTRWQGQCKECGEWNTLVEERIVTPAKGGTSQTATASKKALLTEISGESLIGMKSGIDEFDRVLGGHLLSGMTVLLGGDPGIGKSTLVLQAAEAYSRIGVDVLYVTGEESPAQLKQRANRLSVSGERITVVNTTSLEEVIGLVNETTYGIVIVDSIQTVATSAFDSPPGTVGQVRESAQQLINLSKAQGFALLLVGHVTKEGMVAGPKVLEHMVDTVLYFDGDNQHLYRILRAVKNRFGSVAEIGLFEMAPQGLIEVANPSSLFLSGDLESERTGSAVCAIVEGNRPIMVEVQALVSNANYGTPQRVAGGMDQKRLALLLAIIEKRCGMPMGTNDVFVHEIAVYALELRNSQL